MKTITSRGFGSGGFVFYLDLAFAVIAMLFAVFLMLSFFSEETRSVSEKIAFAKIETTAVFAADSIVKNSTEGCAVNSPAKRRVESNSLSSDCLKMLEGKHFGEYRIGRINISGETLFNSCRGENYSVKRFVLVDGKKSVLEVGLCE